PELPRGIYSIDMAKTAPVLQIRITSPQIPGDVWTYNFESEALSRVTLSSSAGVDLSAMVLPETITFKARDGVDLYGLFYPPRPQEIDEKPPVVLMVHGGPTAQARPQFNTTIQYLLARGYAVFDFNYRGSTGYGRTYVSLDDKRLRPNAILDVEDAMGWLESSGRVDVDKAAIFGGSYGGYMVNAALGAFPDLFAAGVSFVGVSDWVRALEEASPSLKASDRFEYGDITDPDDRAYFAEISPLKNADKIKAPILVQHGANDPRDPVTESDRLVQKVRDAGGTVTYIRLKDEGHSIKKITNRVYVYSQVAAFLDEHLMGVAPKTTPKKLPETSALSPMAVTLAAVQAEAKTRFTDQDLKQKNAALTALLQSRMAAQQALIAAAETLRAQLSTVKASELAAEDAAQAASESVGAVETAKIGLAKRKAEVEAAERKQAAAQEAASQATESLENDMRALVTATLAAEAAEVEVQKIDREISALQEEIGVPMSTSSRSAAEVNSQ
ncbi:MAG: alpha/beta hydrolase family protein, partial [Sphingomonadales bacterium]